MSDLRAQHAERLRRAEQILIALHSMRDTEGHYLRLNTQQQKEVLECAISALDMLDKTRTAMLERAANG